MINVFQQEQIHSIFITTCCAMICDFNDKNVIFYQLGLGCYKIKICIQGFER